MEEEIYVPFDDPDFEPEYNAEEKVLVEEEPNCTEEVTV